MNTNKIRVQFGKRCWQCCQLQHLSWLPLRCLPSDKCGKRICNLVVCKFRMTLATFNSSLPLHPLHSTLSTQSPFPEPPPCSAFKSGAFKTNFQFVIKQLRGSCPLPVARCQLPVGCKLAALESTRIRVLMWCWWCMQNTLVVKKENKRWSIKF